VPLHHGAHADVRGSAPSSPANQLLLYGCSFQYNVQGVVNGQSVTDATNFGGGAVEVSQGEQSRAELQRERESTSIDVAIVPKGAISIRGVLPGHPCLFDSNQLAASASISSSPEGESF
jgi:hypothetical protein